MLTGSLVVPVCDASGAVVQLYGRKLADHQREGVALHAWLPGPLRGVFNLDGWRGAEDVVLCASLIDALTVWCAGVHAVTAACGADGFSDELLQALVREGVRRVRIAFVENAGGHAVARAVAVRLSAVGIETLRVRLPMGRDANACVVQSGLPAVARALIDAEPFALPQSPHLRWPSSKPKPSRPRLACRHARMMRPRHPHPHTRPTIAKSAPSRSSCATRIVVIGCAAWRVRWVRNR